MQVNPRKRARLQASGEGGSSPSLKGFKRGRESFEGYNCL